MHEFPCRQLAAARRASVACRCAGFGTWRTIPWCRPARSTGLADVKMSRCVSVEGGGDREMVAIGTAVASYSTLCCTAAARTAAASTPKPTTTTSRPQHTATLNTTSRHSQLQNKQHRRNKYYKTETCKVPPEGFEDMYDTQCMPLHKNK